MSELVAAEAMHIPSSVLRLVLIVCVLITQSFAHCHVNHSNPSDQSTNHQHLHCDWFTTTVQKSIVPTFPVDIQLAEDSPDHDHDAIYIADGPWSAAQERPNPIQERSDSYLVLNVASISRCEHGQFSIQHHTLIKCHSTHSLPLYLRCAVLRL
jgi:methionine-rich copper-binding protein CopC